MVVAPAERRSLRVSVSSFTTARKNAVSRARPTLSPKGGTRATRGSLPAFAAPSARGTSVAGSTATPSGFRCPSSSAVGRSVVFPRNPAGEAAGTGLPSCPSELHAPATRARTSALERLHDRIMRARHGNHRVLRDLGEASRLLVEVGGDEAEVTGGHVGDADAPERVVAQHALEVAPALDE